MIALITLLVVSVIAGLITGYLITTLAKWKIFEYYDYYRPKWMGEACLHCLSFWLSFPVLYILLIRSGATPEWIYLLAPFASASVAKWSNNYR